MPLVQKGSSLKMSFTSASSAASTIHKPPERTVARHLAHRAGHEDAILHPVEKIEVRLLQLVPQLAHIGLVLELHDVEHQVPLGLVEYQPTRVLPAGSAEKHALR